MQTHQNSQFNAFAKRAFVVVLGLAAGATLQGQSGSDPSSGIVLFDLSIPAILKT